MPGGTRKGTPISPAPEGTTDADAAQIEAMVRAMPEWQRTLFTRLRDLIHEVDPGVVEAIKWRKPSNPDGVPVWSHDGILFTGNVWKDHVRLTFANGGLLKDPKRVFNAALNGNYMRALDLREGDEFDEGALKVLIRAAVALNKATAARRRA